MSPLKTKHRKHHPYTTANLELDSLLDKIVQMAGNHPNQDLMKEMMVTAIKSSDIAPYVKGSMG